MVSDAGRQLDLLDPTPDRPRESGTTVRVFSKKLTKSDLTITAAYWDQKHKQQAIIMGLAFPEMFPAARDEETYTVDARVHGPRSTRSDPTELREINKSTKEWRFGGTLLGPATRYSGLHPGDIAVIRFESDDGRIPVRANLIFLESSHPSDADAYSVTSGLTSGARAILEPSELAEGLEKTGVPRTHAIWVAVGDIAPTPEDILAAAEGDTDARKRLGGRHISAEEVEAARARMAEIGRYGEALVDTWFAGAGGDDLDEYEWTAAADPFSPFDFRTVRGQEVELIEVKSTTSPHDQPFLISVGELRRAAEANEPYCVYRVSKVTETGGSLRVSQPIKDLAKTIIAELQKLPRGVEASSLRIKPSSLTFGPAVDLSR